MADVGRAGRRVGDALVARRRHLPGLRAQLRRRRRRRHRRPARHPVPAAVPRRPRRRRHLAHAVLPVAPGRRRLRRGRLPRRRPALRHPRRLRRAGRRRPRARPAGDRRPRPNHTSERAPVVPGRARRRRRAARSGPATCSATGAGPAATQPPNDWQSVFGGAGVDAGRRGRRHAGPVVPAPVRARAARPRLDQPRGARPSSSRSCASGSTAASTASASTSPTAWPRTRTCPTSTAASTPAGPARARPPALGPGRGPRRLPAVAAGHRRATTATGPSWPRRGCTTRAAGPLRAARRAAHRVQLQLPARAVGRRRRCARDDRREHRARSAARRRAGHLGAVEPRRRPPRHPLRRRRRSALRRARAAALLMLALPGGAYVYQGEELGLPRSPTCPTRCSPGPDVPAHRRAPSAAATAAGCRCRGRATRRRSASAPPAAPWLPQPAAWAALAPSSAQAATRTRCWRCTATRCACAASSPALGDGALEWLDAATADVLAFRRAPGFVCVVNLGAGAVALADLAGRDVGRCWRAAARPTAPTSGPATAVWLTVPSGPDRSHDSAGRTDRGPVCVPTRCRGRCCTLPEPGRGERCRRSELGVSWHASWSRPRRLLAALAARCSSARLGACGRRVGDAEAHLVHQPRQRRAEDAGRGVLGGVRRRLHHHRPRSCPTRPTPSASSSCAGWPPADSVGRPDEPRPAVRRRVRQRRLPAGRSPIRPTSSSSPTACSRAR